MVYEDNQIAEIHNHFHGNGTQFMQNPSHVSLQNLHVNNSDVNGNIVAAGEIKNSKILKQVQSSASIEESSSDPIVEQLLANIQICIAPLNGEIPNQQLQEILQELALLTTETKRRPTRKSKLSASLACLHEAAQDLDELGKFLLDEVRQLNYIGNVEYGL